MSRTAGIADCCSKSVWGFSYSVSLALLVPFSSTQSSVRSFILNKPASTSSSVSTNLTF